MSPIPPFGSPPFSGTLNDKTLKLNNDVVQYATIGAELSSQDFTDGSWTTTGWTVDDPTDATHNTGNFNALSTNSFTPVIGHYYRLSGSINSGTAATPGTPSASLGGVGGIGVTQIDANTVYLAPLTVEKVILAVSTAQPKWTSSSTYDGQVTTLSVMEVVPVPASSNLLNSNVSGFSLQPGDTTNTFIGTSAGQFVIDPAVGGGTNNFAVGPLNLGNNIEGQGNLAIGYQCLANNTGGNYNVALGYQSQNLGLSGSNNLSIGYFTLNQNRTGSRNIAMGFQSMRFNSTGNSNIFLGINSGSGNITGSYNVGIGDNAAEAPNTKSTNRSIAIGASSTYSTNLENAVAIGAYASATTSNTIILGQVGSANHGFTGFGQPKVGIQTLTPNTDLDVKGWINTSGGVRVSTQFDKTSNTTLATITGLSVTVVAGRTYDFEAKLFLTAGAVGGSKYAIGGTATATNIIYDIILLDETTNTNTITSRQTAMAGSAGQASTTSGLCRISGTITVNAGGTLTCQFAQNVSNGTTCSILVGSTFKLIDIQ